MIRTQGHLEGLQTAKNIVRAAAEIGISYLTLYTFSTENWKRSAEEVGFILSLIKQYLRSELDFYRDNRIRLRHAGSREGLPADILSELDQVRGETSHYTGIQVILALNYGGRDEIVRAVKRLIREKSGGLPENLSADGLTEADISAYMDNPDIPDPDLIIRTAGEFRTSNFLLWEGAYAEYYISDKLWPDWEKNDLIRAINEFKNRDRRYGGIQA